MTPVGIVMRKRHGFPGQHHLIVPQDIVRAGRRHPLLAKLLPTAAGYFPHAAGHYVVRPEGVAEVIVILCSAGRGWFELAGTSTSHLSALFRRKVGYPPMDYFARLKIQRACWLLDSTTAPVKEIGAQIGCSDAYYFSRLFRQIMGMSPRSYRAIPKG